MRHASDGDCPFLVISRTTKEEALSLPIRDLDFGVKAEENALLVATYMSEAKSNVTYYKSIPLIPGAPIKQAFQESSPVLFSFIANDKLAKNEDSLDLSAEDFVGKICQLCFRSWFPARNLIGRAGSRRREKQN
jgi:hypothetical protein